MTPFLKILFCDQILSLVLSLQNNASYVIYDNHVSGLSTRELVFLKY